MFPCLGSRPSGATIIIHVYNFNYLIIRDRCQINGLEVLCIAILCMGFTTVTHFKECICTQNGLRIPDMWNAVNNCSFGPHWTTQTLHKDGTVKLSCAIHMTNIIWMTVDPYKNRSTHVGLCRIASYYGKMHLACIVGNLPHDVGQTVIDPVFGPPPWFEHFAWKQGLPDVMLAMHGPPCSGFWRTWSLLSFVSILGFLHCIRFSFWADVSPEVLELCQPVYVSWESKH